ncbi:MAG: tRNA (adenosine(37)-N6)-dimethylallyltransferase MiaA [Clostridia bacterium]|nr:tRNA (adenosine(37)-N6)-dimethylallyltransferase MiaA [Clostridia bacterium]
MSNGNLIVVLGPTASGKSGLAVEIAEKYNGEVVSCDSMQVYKGLSISTAQPTKEEMNGIPHHLIGFFDITTNFNAGEYQNLAREAIADIQNRGKLPILCGGTGLYIDSVIYNMDLANVPENTEIRRKYSEYFSEHGAHALHDILANKSPEMANRIHQNNVQRVIRALEVYDMTGSEKKEYYNKNMKKFSYDRLLIFGLKWDRAELYERIDRRVDMMIEAGLVNEIKTARENGLKSTNTAYKAIGCKELYRYFDNEISLQDAIKQIKQYSRNYAKRQITWFKRIEEINWINCIAETGYMSGKSEIFTKIENIYF